MELKKYVTYQQTLIPVEDRLKSVAGQEVYLAADVEAQLTAQAATLAELREENEALKADRVIKNNGARLMARYVVSHLKKPKDHTDGEILNTANGVLKNDLPSTTPWLVQMMDVARRDKSELPQQLFQAIEQRDKLQQQLTSAQATIEKQTAESMKAMGYLDAKLIDAQATIQRLERLAEARWGALKMLQEEKDTLKQRLATVEAALKDCVEALIATHPDSKVIREQLADGSLERRLQVVGAAVFDPLGRVRAMLQARQALAPAPGGQTKEDSYEKA